MSPPLTTSDAEAQRTCSHHWNTEPRGWNCALCGLWSFAPTPPDYGIPQAAVRTDGVQALRERAEKAEAERDAAIAQRDRVVAAGRAVIDAWTGPYWIISPLCDVLDSIGIPVPDKLAAEREAGRRAGLDEAADIVSDKAQTFDPDGEDAEIWCLVDAAKAIRALRDTPAAPVEGGDHG